MDRPWTTGFFKDQIPGPVLMGAAGLEGDGQADLVHHGGPDKAVLAYSAGHYPAWRLSMGDPRLPFGAFGENLTIAALTEADVCVGDTWRIGDSATVQVSQPRQPCWKLARRWRIKTLALEVQDTGRTGWYFRVLAGGAVSPGMGMKLLERPHPDWTIRRANRVMHSRDHDADEMMGLASLALLSASWRETLERHARGVKPDSGKRLAAGND